MNLESDLDEVLCAEDIDVGNAGITRELIMQYIAAGILFPEEIRCAEQILRKLSSRNG